MMYEHFPIIAVMVLFLGAFLIEIFGSGNTHRPYRHAVSMIFVTISAVLVFMLIKPVFIDGQIITYWFGNWEPVNGWAIGIGYEVDQLGLFFGLLVAGTFFLSTMYSIRFMDRNTHLGHYFTLLLMLSGAVLGLVFTGDLFNLFIMVEIMTFAAAALTAFRNYRNGALEAGFKYLVIGSIGSSMTLLGITLLYLQAHTLNMAQLSQVLRGNITPVSVLALGLMITGFGVKSFIVPFHTPAADAYTVAPSPISMAFASMVNKAGVYGMIRILFIVFCIMDVAAVRVLIVIIGTVTMFVGVTMALAQHDFKRLLAFHSISQIGYVIMAIGLGTAMGVTGGLFHTMNHTLFKGLLFLCAGAVLYQTGTTDLDKLGGLSKRMPQTCICFLIGAFSISGLPPFNGFASKWIIYQAAYSRGMETGDFLYALVTIVAVVVSVMTLASFIKVTQAVFFGQLRPGLQETEEAPLTMRIPMWIMAGLCVFCGLFYNFINEKLLSPAMNAVFAPDRYYAYMFEGADAAPELIRQQVTFSVWDPMLWLVLFAVVLAAACVVIFTAGRDNGRIIKGEGTDGKNAVFFSGEKAMYSHVGGSDLFWGFRKNWKGYFRVMQGLHSGNLNDYSTYVVFGGTIIILLTFIFVH